MEGRPTTRGTLCFPDGKRSCIGCCPPIRPAGYDHLDHRAFIKRMLLENTRSFKARGPIRPITGYSCWAMGYLDEACALPGCLLHPERNNGEDLRHRVDFGEKCRRESCEEAKIFDALSIPAREGCTAVSFGLDSFQYSSRRANPVFRLLNWGERLLDTLFEEERDCFDWQDLVKRYPFFLTSLNPKAFRYLAEGVVSAGGLGLLREDPGRLEGFFRRNASRAAALHPMGYGGVRPHLLPVPKAFADFLRLGAGISSIPLENALRIKEFIDEEITGGLR